MRKPVRWVLWGLVVCAVGLAAERMALFLEDGTSMAVREYEVVENRVRYFSSERGQWEEVPLEIVDLERTRGHNRSLQTIAEAREQEVRRERIAERRARTELHSVPLDDGIYYLRDGNPEPIEQATVDVGRATKRTVLNVISPVPVMAGKQTMSVAGLSAKTVTTGDKPIFYIRLEDFSRFGISRLKLEPGRDRRIVQLVYTVPRAEEHFERQEEIDVFRQQLAPLVYKIWPVEPLEAGEYALVDFTPGELNLRAWDFSHRPAGSAEHP